MPNFMPGGPFLTLVPRGGSQTEHCRIAELQRYILEIRKVRLLELSGQTTGKEAVAQAASEISWGFPWVCF